LELLTGLGDFGDVLALPWPELDGGIAEARRFFQPAHEGQPAPPHLEVDGKTRVRRAAQTRYVFVLSRRQRGAAGRDRRRARQKLAPTFLHDVFSRPDKFGVRWLDTALDVSS